MFSKVLIANRGEIALRVLRALRSLDIRAVAVYHHSDRHSPVVEQADEAIELFGDSPTAAYLDIEQIVAACQQLNVDAVHPCYGFLSENALFAKALNAAGIAFVGPAADVIELMGDKIRSRDFVAKHGFPVPPSVSLDADDPALLDAVADMPLPLVVKASAGGGGKGMSIVRSLDELAATLRLAASEAEKYFGDKRVYVERYFENARHIEVQVLGDGERVIHLWERECSVQRRFQKIIEESPAPGLSQAQREAICDTAVGIAQSANYSSAGTVEFLYTQRGEFFFLEMNTRIQVEHPVTEMLTGVDLVAAQLRIASGEKLWLQQADIQARGHALECRLCAEDADNDFIPETGRVLYLREPQAAAGKTLRFDSGLYPQQEVTTAYDPMLAKLIVHADNRDAAIADARQGLADTVVLGVNTNIDYLDRLLAHPAFIAGEVDTGFIGEHQDSLQRAALDRDSEQLVLSAALLNDREQVQTMERTPSLHAAIGRWRN